MVALTVIFVSILIVYSSGSRKHIGFLNEESLLVGSILRAKAFSVETFQPSQSVISNIPSGEKICGWGVHLEKAAGQNQKDYYVIYRDLDSNSGVSSCNTSVGVYDPGTSEDYETLNLDPTIATIKCLDLLNVSGGDCANTGLTKFDVFFLPPEPKVFFNPSNPNYVEAIAVLEINGGGRCSEIRINNAGQISVNETLNC